MRALWPISDEGGGDVGGGAGKHPGHGGAGRAKGVGFRIERGPQICRLGRRHPKLAPPVDEDASPNLVRRRAPKAPHEEDPPDDIGGIGRDRHQEYHGH